MDGATFTIVICNASPPLGGTMTSITNLHKQDLMIVDLVTNFRAIDDVTNIMLEDVLREGGSFQQVS